MSYALSRNAHVLIVHSAGLIKAIPRPESKSVESRLSIMYSRYQLEIIDKHIKEHVEDEPLPIVVPLVFYNGVQSPYPYPVSIDGLVSDRALFAKIWLGEFKLVDLTITEDSEILQHRKLALLEMLLKHIRAKDFKREVTDLILEALAIAHLDSLPKYLFDSMLSYLTAAKDEEDLKPLFHGIIDKFAEYRGGYYDLCR